MSTPFMGTAHEELLSTAEAAKCLGMAEPTLRLWRHKGIGPRSFKMGGHRVLYRRADLDEWVEAQYRQALEEAGVQVA